MKIAIVNEISAAARNGDILEALSGRGFELLNLGNKSPQDPLPLQYIHTGLLSAIVINFGIADFVVGGCGTGLGYLNSVLQYPGVSCGHILTPLDAWLFSRINDGNCVSLALNQGYGWAGEINLHMIFDELFTEEKGKGFPSHRAEPQQKSREILANISSITHKPFRDILKDLPTEITRPVFQFPAFKEVLLACVDNNQQFNFIRALI